MNTNELLDLVCDALEIENGVLKMETNIKSIEEWDSVGWLTIMAQIDENYGVQLEAKRLRSLTTVADFVQYVGERVSQKN